MWSLNELPEASENHKISGFRSVLEDNDQPTSSYHLLVDGASTDILADIDDRVSSSSSGMHLKKVSKLLTYPCLLSHHLKVRS